MNPIFSSRFRKIDDGTPYKNTGRAAEGILLRNDFAYERLIRLCIMNINTGITNSIYLLSRNGYELGRQYRTLNHESSPVHCFAKNSPEKVYIWKEVVEELGQFFSAR